MTRLHSSPVSTKQPVGADNLRRTCLETGNPHPGLVTAGTTTKIEMKARQADVSATAAAVTAAMTGAVPAAMPVTRTAAMADRAIAINRMAVTIIACDSTFAVNRRATGAASVRVTAAGAVSIQCLRRGGCEHGKADRDSEEGDDLFHDELGFGLSRCRQRAACKSDAAPMRLFSGFTSFHSFDL